MLAVLNFIYIISGIKSYHHDHAFYTGFNEASFKFPAVKLDAV